MNLKDKINKMPESPGIYIMKDDYNNVIYVGKSINLKSRVKSYFRDNLNRSRKIERMVKSIKDIDYITTDTELDALLLECDYIHNIRPMYNTLMNNYEKYKYIKLNVNSLNLIHIVDEQDDHSTYFGPFSMNKRLFTLRDFLLDYFKLPTCNTKTKCIRYNIEKCMGPCRVNTKEKYEEIYRVLKNTFEGKDDLIKKLENEMVNQSSLLNFEKAMEIKSNMELLKSISKKQNTFNLFKNNCKFVLWMKMNENNYKLYFINNVKVVYSQIINVEDFDEKMKREVKNKIEEFKLNKHNKVLYDKSYIDYINIIYSYIYKNEKIDYIQL